jgi:hypothetical protein
MLRLRLERVLPIGAIVDGNRTGSCRAIDFRRKSGVRAEKMARFGQVALRGGALLGVLWGMAVACGGSTPDAARGASKDVDLDVPCGEDQVREYFCDDLLPLSSSRPAPEPYDNCPSTSEVRPGNYKALDRLAVFDRNYTAYTRRRVQPGHSCCYGWCAKVTLADASKAAPAACRDSDGLPQTFCMREFETGTSQSAASPFGKCAAAIKPPEVVAFSVPSSALLDIAGTAKRRQDTLLADCCYGWCSQVPSGTVLKTQPKTK